MIQQLACVEDLQVYYKKIGFIPTFTTRTNAHLRTHFYTWSVYVHKIRCKCIHTHAQMHRCTHSQMHTRTDAQMHTLTDAHTHRCTDAHTHRCTDAHTHRCTHSQMHTRTHKLVNAHTHKERIAIPRVVVVCKELYLPQKSRWRITHHPCDKFHNN